MPASKQSPISFILALTLGFGFSASARTIYVDRDIPVSGTGFSWASPKKTITEAVAIATSGDMIWVAEGRYSESLNLSNHVNLALYGGFVGTESLLSQRNFRAHPTIVDVSQAAGGNPAAYAVAFTLNQNVRFDGFTVTGAVTDALTGGAVVAFDCTASDSLTIANCTITSNTGTPPDAGGIYLYRSRMTVTSCTIQDNYGCGITVHSLSDVLIRNCLLQRNWTSHWGAGIYVGNGEATITSCVLADNTAQGEGGAMAFQQALRVDITSCVLYGKSAGVACPGGAIANW